MTVNSSDQIQWVTRSRRDRRTIELSDWALIKIYSKPHAISFGLGAGGKLRGPLGESE